jgi:hypothetical protein
MQDHFFDRGGDSLLATRMLARAKAALRVDLPLSILFNAPVLDAFSKRVEEALAAQ